MAKRGRPKKQKEITQDEPVPSEGEAVVVKAKPGRPKKTQETTKSKRGRQKKEQKPLKKDKTITIEIPAKLLDYFPSEAITHFLAAKRSFLQGILSLINRNLESLPEKKRTPSKKRKKTEVIENS